MRQITGKTSLAGMSIARPPRAFLSSIPFPVQSSIGKYMSAFQQKVPSSLSLKTRTDKSASEISYTFSIGEDNY